MAKTRKPREPKALTVPGILKLKGHKQRREIWDQNGHGLVLVIGPAPASHKSFAFRFRKPNKAPAKLTLGAFTTVGTQRSAGSRAGAHPPCCKAACG